MTDESLPPMPEKVQVTSHMLWNQLLHTTIDNAMLDVDLTRTVAEIWAKQSVGRKRNEAYAVARFAWRERDRAIHAMAEHFHNTRVRIMTEAMIAYLDATTARMKELQAEHQGTNPLRFARRRAILRQYADQEILQSAYKAALLAIVNTPPPANEQPPVPEAQTNGQAPAMEVTRGKCGRCAGSGYATPEIPSEERLCPHCHGTGVEPEGGGQTE